MREENSLKLVLDQRVKLAEISVGLPASYWNKKKLKKVTSGQTHTALGLSSDKLQNAPNPWQADIPISPRKPLIHPSAEVNNGQHCAVDLLHSRHSYSHVGSKKPTFTSSTVRPESPAARCRLPAWEGRSSEARLRPSLLPGAPRSPPPSRASECWQASRATLHKKQLLLVVAVIDSRCRSSRGIRIELSPFH